MARARATTIPWAGGRPRGPRVKGYQRTVVDGIAFHSKAEARRWQELVLLEKAGAIRDLRRQVHIPLVTMHAGAPVHVCVYVADFVYQEQTIVLDERPARWVDVCEDVKGMRTDVYKLKKRWFEAQTGQTIRETMPARAARRRKR